MEHLLVGLGPERYAVPVAQVLEVAAWEQVCAVPGAPTAILGVRNLRGELLPVVDLAPLLEAARRSPEPMLVVVEVPGARAMLAADEVIDVSAFEAADEQTKSELLSGALLLDGRLVGVLDVGAVLGAVARERA